MQNFPSEAASKPAFDLHFGHLGVIALAGLVLVGLTFMKAGFRLPLLSQTSSQKQLTYDAVKSQVLAENSLQNSNQSQDQNGASEQQLAIIDPSRQEAQVLGASIGLNGEFPAAEEMFTPQVLSVIKIKLLPDTNAEALKKYSSQVALVESYNQVADMIGKLNGDDKETLLQAAKDSKIVVANLALIQVPKDLAEYHKLKMMYYTTLGQMAEIFAGTRDNAELTNTSAIFFGLTQRMENIKSDIQNKYSVGI